MEPGRVFDMFETPAVQLDCTIFEAMEFPQTPGFYDFRNSLNWDVRGCNSHPTSEKPAMS